MRDPKTFITDLVRKPPMLLPFVALAHILWLILTVAIQSDLIQIAWLVGYTALWLAACDLRKWGVFGYLALTIANTLLFVAVKNVYERNHYMSNLFIIDMIFCAILVFYFKRFQTEIVSTAEETKSHEQA